ncbi:DoxX family protein [Luteimonas sp. R10]|uniref:DoxX family protein n=1 Tax=Luteimonas sp. R10 TaxID=3108176 RepID=UPI00308D009D|nr:DoxX family protein [Luteimonas sp. R10]
MDTFAAATPNTRPGPSAAAVRGVWGVIALFERIPQSAIALLARFSIAVTFWLSGQTKIEGLVLDPIGRTVELGLPRMSGNAVELFRSEYALPLIPPELAATTAAVAEHVLPLLLLIGLATRFSAFALLIMTLVIQVFVYPDAFATHGMWAVAMLYLMARGPGRVSLDHLIARRDRA